MKIETVVPLPPEDSGLQHCIARFHNRNMDSKRKDKTRFQEGAVMIVNPETKARFSGMRWATLGIYPSQSWRSRWITMR